MALGIDDPEAWLDRIDQRTFDIWEAYYQCEPFGNEWAQTASVLSMVSGLQSMTAAVNGQKMKVVEPLDFMPGDSLSWKRRQKAAPKRGGITDGKLQTTYILASFGFRQ